MERKGAHGGEGISGAGSYTKPPVDTINKSDYPTIRFHRNPHLSVEYPNNLLAGVERFAFCMDSISIWSQSEVAPSIPAM